MNACFEEKQTQLFFHKLSELLDSALFDDIVFNCRNGKVSGNRLILSVYSQFMQSLFEINPLITSHPLNDSDDNGINLPEIDVKDMRKLLQLLNSGESLRMSGKELCGVKKLAKIFQIKLDIKLFKPGVMIVEALPKSGESETTADDSESDESKSSKCETSEKSKNKNSTELDPRVCPICNITCRSWQGMKRHVGHSHRGVDPKILPIFNTPLQNFPFLVKMTIAYLKK
ncbi:hypothetical protein B4U79_18342, partial [Dinothrombium tinctorium]